VYDREIDQKMDQGVITVKELTIKGCACASSGRPDRVPHRCYCQRGQRATPAWGRSGRRHCEKRGRIIQEESNRIGFVPVGKAAITGAGALKAGFVIHAVGPRWGEGDEKAKLSSAVRSSLKLAAERGFESLAIRPSAQASLVSEGRMRPHHCR